MAATDPIIFDFGSLISKVGLGGDADPYATFITAVGSDGTVGKTAIDKRTSDDRPVYPITRGFVTKWDVMDKIYNTAFQLVDPIADNEATKRNIILATPSQASRLDREKHAKLLFEKYQVPALTMVNTAELSLYHVGKRSGLVVDVGHGTTNVVPIWDHNIFTHAQKRNEMGGQDIELFLKELTKERAQMDIETARVIKERPDGLLYIAPDLSAEVARENEIVMDYELPDGNKVTLTRERFFASEVLFDPEYMDKDVPSIQKSIQTAVAACDMNVRKNLYENIYIVGGTTYLKNFQDRLKTELEKIVPSTVQLQLNAHEDRNYAAWIGGSVISQLSTFKNMLVTKQDYSELGDNIINQRFKN